MVPSIDTHHAMQIFHAICLVNDRGEHPAPFTLVSAEDVEAGRGGSTRRSPRPGLEPAYAQRHLLHYTRATGRGRQVRADHLALPLDARQHRPRPRARVEEAIFFHGIARPSQPDFQVKGDNPLTEHYSMLGPEVIEGPDGERLATATTRWSRNSSTFDVVVVAGQAKSHCVAWTIDDLLAHEARARRSARRTTCWRTALRPSWFRA